MWRIEMGFSSEVLVGEFDLRLANENHTEILICPHSLGRNAGPKQAQGRLSPIFNLTVFAVQRSAFTKLSGAYGV